MQSVSVMDKVKPYVSPLNINGMRGRVLNLASNSKHSREILLLYGHHSSLERMYGIAEFLSEYGNVTMPDLPGFGGMDSFYKIGMKPTLDDMADYLAAYIKLRYKGKKITIMGMSFGFVVATRMLQRIPNMSKQVEMIVSVVGFCHKDDFTFKKSRYWFYRLAPKLFGMRIPAILFRNIILHPTVIRLFYGKTKNAKAKLAGLNEKARKEALDFEVYLWRCNEVRTYMVTTVEMMTLDNCKAQIDLPVWHVAVANDQYFDRKIVEQHMRIVYSDYIECEARLNSHAPSILADAEEARPLFPTKLREELSK